jgi:hypothetical protein
MNIKNVSMAALLVVGAGLSAQDADAAYSGTIRRTVCARAGLVPSSNDATYWSATSGATCTLTVSNPGSPSTYRYAAASIPVERASSTTSITSKAFVGGHWLGGGGEACVAAYVYNPDGSLSAGTSSVCLSTYGAGYLQPSSLTLPIDGATVFNFALQDTAYVRTISHSWIANGT